MPSDFIASSVAAGLRVDEFAHLSRRDRKKLVRLMARIAEQSYRRGAQQAVHFAEQGCPRAADALANWRFERSLDKAPPLAGPEVGGSVERLFAECPVLHELGFEEAPQ